MKLNTKTSDIILKICFFSLFTFHFSLLLAQEKRDEKATSAEKINSIQATGDDIKFKDDSNNELFNIIDEGNFGSIKFSSGVPTVKTNKLYNDNGSLFFGGNKLLTNLTLARLSDLADVNSDNFSYLLLGTGSGISNTGANNTSLGLNSLHSNTTGTNNTALGYLAMYTNISGDSNVAIGTNALQFGKGSNNTAIGINALQNINSGSCNTAIGFRALQNLNNPTNANYANIAIGAYALSNLTGSEGGNIALGTYALFNSQSAFGNNTAIGHQSQKNAAGSRNISLGGYTLFNAISSQDNIAIGYRAMYDGAGSQDNVAIGAFSLENNNGGYSNTTCGNGTLTANIGGHSNTALGNGAGNANTTGNSNTLVGVNSNIYNETGSSNVMVGFEAGMGNIGQSKSGNIFIGYKAGKNEIGSDLLYIENSDNGSPLIWGDFANDIVAVNGKFGVGTQVPSDKVEIDAATGEDALRIKVGNATKLRVFTNGGTSIGSNFAGTPANGLYVAGDIQNPSGVLHSSDIRFKKNITTIPNCIESIKSLNGIYYDWKTEEFPERNFNNDRQIGVIAQEIEKFFPELVCTDNDGYKSVNYSKLTPILIEAIKEQEKKIEKIEKQNEELVKQNLEYRTQNEKTNEEISQIKNALNQIIELKENVSFTNK